MWKPSFALTTAVLACQAHSGLLVLTITWLASSQLQDEWPCLPHRASGPASMSMMTLILAGALSLISLHSRGRMDPLQKTIYHHNVIQKIHKANNAATAFSGTRPGESGAHGLHWRPTNSSPNWNQLSTHQAEKGWQAMAWTHSVKECTLTMQPNADEVHRHDYGGKSKSQMRNAYCFVDEVQKEEKSKLLFRW